VAVTDGVKSVLKSAGYDVDVAEHQQVLGRLVGCEPTDPAYSERLQKVIDLAVAEWLSWAVAEKRFSTLSELDTHRVLNLFLEIRQSAPTVEALVEELAIPQGRAISMISRMKYGRARQLLRLSFEAAAREVGTRLASAKEVSGERQITVTRETLDRLRDAEFDVFSAPDGQYQSRQLLSVQSSGRLGAVVRTSVKTWEHLAASLASRASA
jgi:hypothetical protein